MKWVVALLFMSLAFAGCADEAPQDTGDEELEGVDEELKATSDTGVIRGVVVDPTITPVPGVTVTIITTGQSTITNEQGAFGFSELEPGTYFLKATKIGYFEVQQSVEVVAGVEKPDVTKILMEVDAGSIPFWQDIYWQGFFNCSTAALQVCPAPNVVLGALGYPPVTEDEFMVVHEMEGNMSWIQSELIWESTQATGDTLDLYFETTPKDSSSFTHRFSEVGESPVMVAANRTAIEAYGLGTTNDLQHRVFPGGIDEELPGVLIGAQLMQDFEIFTHVFYNYEPTQGWRFSDDPTVPAPPQ